MLALDISRPLRNHLQLRDLIDAVLAADAADETDWAEWKTDIDLGTTAGRATVARHILGLSNRQPELAARQAGGCGYLLAGVEPGNLVGVTPVDLADLEPQVQRYLGSQGPIWTPQFVRHGQTQVLVVIIDPPQPGDPIFRLEREYSAGKTTYRSGTVFVRRKAQTEIANAAELDALQTRLLQRAGQLQVTLELGEQTLAIPRLDLSDEALQPWLFKDRALRLSARGSDAYSPGSDAHYNALFGALRDLRTLEQYQAEVDRYIEQLREPAREHAFAIALRQGLGQLDLRLSNPTDRNFRAVEVIVDFPKPVVAGDDEPDGPLPVPPWPLGTPRSVTPRLAEVAAPVLPRYNASSIASSIAAMTSRVEIDNRRSARLRFSPVDLRPRERVPLDLVQLFSVADLQELEVIGTWTATSTDTDRVVTGTIRAAVEPKPRTASELLDSIDGQRSARRPRQDQSA